MKRVPCYALDTVLTHPQYAKVRPFLRATFTETWAECCVAVGACGFDARAALREASRVFDGHVSFRDAYACNAREGYTLELLLYAEARKRGARVVMGPERQ